jgi:hypothetical protein
VRRIGVWIVVEAEHSMTGFGAVVELGWDREKERCSSTPCRLDLSCYWLLEMYQ